MKKAVIVVGKPDAGKSTTIRHFKTLPNVIMLSHVIRHCQSSSQFDRLENGGSVEAGGKEGVP